MNALVRGSSRALNELSNQDNSTDGRHLTLVLEGLAAIAAVLFVIGNAYGRAYYEVLGIGISLLEIESTTKMSWSTYLIRQNFVAFLVVPLLAVYTLPLIRFLFIGMTNFLIGGQAKWVRKIISHLSFMVWLLLLAYILVSWLPDNAREVAYKEAMEALNAGDTKLPEVSFIFKSTDGAQDTFLSELKGEYLYRDNSFRYIGVHKDVHYFLTVRTAGNLGEPVLHMIPADVVGAIIHEIKN